VVPLLSNTLEKLKMIEYTPGPWGVEQTSCSNWIGRMRPDGTKIDHIVAHTDRDSLRDDVLVRNDANARLIAAAPDMFEALEAIAGNHDAGPGIDAAELCELMTQRAREVLAKVREDAKPVTELRAAVLAILGGVGAISPRLYGQALDRIAKITGRVNDESFRNEVTECLRSVPCPLD
jgi:hypothetical protein